MTAHPRGAVIVAVDGHDGPRARVGDALERRHGSDHRIVVVASEGEALAALRDARDAGEEVALVLADHAPPAGGAGLLAQVPALFPRARRGLLVEFGAWGDPEVAAAIHRAMSLGQCDYYVLKPWRSPDEFFNRTVAEFLHEWSRTTVTGPSEVVVVGHRDRRTQELRSLLARSGIPSTFQAADGPGAGISADLALPAVAFHDGRVLEQPTNAEIVGAFGLSTRLARTDHDVVIVGGGPGGLAAAVYAASEGLATLVVERDAIGGQAGSSSLIRNYLGFPRGVSGAELAMRAYQQAWVFGAHFVVMHGVDALERDGAGLMVALSDGSRARAGAVVLATGVDYRRLGIPALEALVGTGVFYGASVSEAQGLAGESVYVVGGGNSAGQAAMHLARYARHVTIVVRGASVASTMSRYLVDLVAAAPNVSVLPHAEVVDGSGAGRLERLVLADRRDGTRTEVQAAGLFVMIGAHPRSEWLPADVVRDEWGYVVTGADVPEAHRPSSRAPLPLETSMPGVFAIGDMRHRSMKRVAAAVGDGAGVIPQVHEHLAGIAQRAALSPGPPQKA